MELGRNFPLTHSGYNRNVATPPIISYAFINWRDETGETRMSRYYQYTIWLVVLGGWYLASGSLAQELQAPRPISALDSVFIEELTWMEVRDAIKAGKTTVVVGTGGIEPNGPYVALGKH